MQQMMARGAQAYYQTQIQSRSPLELVVMLYDGALRFLQQSIDAMQRGEVKLVLNTVAGAKSIADSFALRRTALMGGIPYFTTVSGIVAAVGAIAELSKGELEVAPLQSYFLASDQPAAR